MVAIGKDEKMYGNNGYPAKVGLKVRYNKPTPKMLVKAALDAPTPRTVKSREALQAEQRYKQQKFEQRRARQEADARERLLRAEIMVQQAEPVSAEDVAKILGIMGISGGMSGVIASFASSILMTGILWIALFTFFTLLLAVIAYWGDSK